MSHSSQKIQYHKVFVDLDSLLDTRYGTLINLNKDIAEELLLSGYYENRLRDEYKNISQTIFYKYYNQRNKLILKYSPPTDIVDLVIDMVRKVLNTNNNSPIEVKLKLLINIHPYMLNEDEQNNLLVSWTTMTSNQVTIEIVNIPIESLSFEYLQSNVDRLIVYEYWKVLDSLSKNYLDAVEKNPKINEKNPLNVFTPQCEVLAPSILFTSVSDIDKDTIKTLQKMNYSPFEYLSKVAQPFIKFTFLKTSLFSNSITISKIKEYLMASGAAIIIANLSYNNFAVTINSILNTQVVPTNWDLLDKEYRSILTELVECFSSQNELDIEQTHLIHFKLLVDFKYNHSNLLDIDNKTSPYLAEYKDIIIEDAPLLLIYKIMYATYKTLMSSMNDITKENPVNY